jgi:lysophospholipase L1-like esterase
MAYIDSANIKGTLYELQDTQARADIGDLESAINNGYNSITTLVNGSFQANGNLTTRTDRLREDTYIQVKSGDKIVIDAGSLKYAVGAWNGTPSTETNVRNDSTFSEGVETIISDFDGYYIIVFAKQTTSQAITPSDFDGEIRVYSGEIYNNKQRISEINVRVDELSDEIDTINTNIGKFATIISEPAYDDIAVALENTVGARTANGAIITSLTDYQYSQKIPVQSGDVITPITDEENVNFRWVCAFSGNTAIVDAGSNTQLLEYTVPDNIDGVVVTTAISRNITAVNIRRQNGTTETVYPVEQKLGNNRWSGDLTSGDTVSLLRTQVRFNTAFVFTGHVTTLGTLTIGVTQDGSAPKTLCAVDATKLYYRLRNGNIVNVEHGLTITNDLQIWISKPFVVNELGSIKIASNGAEYVLSVTSYDTEMNGAPCVISDGSVLTDCAFTQIARDIDKPIWVFGDSWVSMYETRWPYYMVQAGYDKSWMLSGFTGQTSAQSITSLENLLKIRKPQYVVWLMGMNDLDSSSAVSETWKAAYDRLIEICTEYNIVPILYTVPNTPTRNNNFKNAIVRESGYRYIDGVAAVGDNGSGVWFDGYWQSDSDKNHTSAKGARALYYRILTDFPEIASNSL